LLQADFHNVEAKDIPFSPKKLAFKNEVEYSDSYKDELECSDSVFGSDSLELENYTQETTTKFSQKMSHSVSTGEVQLTPYKIAAFFAICFIIGCFTLPIIFYYVNSGDGTDAQEVCLLVTKINALIFTI